MSDHYADLILSELRRIADALEHREDDVIREAKNAAMDDITDCIMAQSAAGSPAERDMGNNLLTEVGRIRREL